MGIIAGLAALLVACILPLKRRETALRPDSQTLPDPEEKSGTSFSKDKSSTGVEKVTTDEHESLAPLTDG